MYYRKTKIGLLPKKSLFLQLPILFGQFTPAPDRNVEADLVDLCFRKAFDLVQWERLLGIKQ